MISIKLDYIERKQDKPMYKTILLEKKNQVAILILNRPEVRNAVNLEMRKEISQALDELEADDEVRVVILTGAGHAFSTGHDMSVPRSEMAEFVSFTDEERLLSFDKPIIAAVHGHTLGYGLQMALVCDIMVASDNAILGFTGPRVGGLDPSSIAILPVVVGRSKASELLFTCDQINADEACRIGMVNKVVPYEQLIPAALEMAGKIMKSAPLSIKYTKRALRLGLSNAAVTSFVQEGLRLLLASDDYQEAVRAFREKREPVFKGE